MARKLIAAAWLLALAASHATALAGLLLAEELPGCCTGSLCTPHQHRHPAPAKIDCGQSNDCSMRSCNPPEQRVVGSQPYLLPEPPAAPWEAPVASEISPAVLFFPAPVADVDSPPPRARLA